MDRAGAEKLDQQDPLAWWRPRFLTGREAGPGPIYMDGNSLGRPSVAVRSAYERGLDDWQRRLVRAWADWIDLPRTVGDRLGRLIGAAPGEVVACDSTTVNLYKLAHAALSARPGRSVILGDEQDFPTDRYVLAGVARQRGCELRLLQSDPVEGLDQADLAAALDERVALVCLSHVHYRSSARLDLPSLTRLCHQSGSVVLWDLSHSVGVVPIDLGASGADLAVGCTYKYLGAGPGAPAFAYVRTALQHQLDQPIWGWFGQADQFAMGPAYEPATGVGRLMTGTPSVLGLLGVEAAAAVIEEAGVDEVWAKSRALTEILTGLVAERLGPLGATLASPADPERRGGHVSVAHPEGWAWCRTLIERGLVVPDFRPPDVVRLGPAPLYTRFVDGWDAVDHMATVLAAGLPSGKRDRPRVT